MRASGRSCKATSTLCSAMDSWLRELRDGIVYRLFPSSGAGNASRSALTLEDEGTIVKDVLGITGLGSKIMATERNIDFGWRKRELKPGKWKCRSLDILTDCQVGSS
jgi:hypothetical protein